MSLTHLNPESLPASPFFSQGVLDDATGTLYVGGQNGDDADGVMLEGFAAQTTQAYRNLLAVLDAAGYDQSNVVKLGIFIVGDEDPTEGLRAAGQVWGNQPTAITVLRVHGLARPDALVEVEAIAHRK